MAVNEDPRSIPGTEPQPATNPRDRRGIFQADLPSEVEREAIQEDVDAALERIQERNSACFPSLQKLRAVNSVARELAEKERQLVRIDRDGRRREDDPQPKINQHYYPSVWDDTAYRKAVEGSYFEIHLAGLDGLSKLRAMVEAAGLPPQVIEHVEDNCYRVNAEAQYQGGW